jgi:hypothetical protein
MNRADKATRLPEVLPGVNARAYDRLRREIAMNGYRSKWPGTILGITNRAG